MILDPVGDQLDSRLTCVNNTFQEVFIGSPWSRLANHKVKGWRDANLGRDTLSVVGVSPTTKLKGDETSTLDELHTQSVVIVSPTNLL